jgi:hypothetical protein
MAVVDRLQARQLLEAVEEVGAHGADQEQRTLAVLQRPGEQGVELLARCRVGEGEQFLELVDDQQECGLLFPCIAQGEGQRALVLLEACCRASMLRRSPVADQPVLDDFASRVSGSLPGIIGPRMRQRSKPVRAHSAPCSIIGSMPALTSDDLPVPLLPSICSQRQ